MSALQEIIKLVERFERNREAYTSGQYKLVYELYGLTEDEIIIVGGG